MYKFKEAYHPNAYLSDFRNVKPGLRTRTSILNVLERGPVNIKEVMNDTKLPYGVILHHLKLLESKGIVQRRSVKPSVWTLTGLGQKRL